MDNNGLDNNVLSIKDLHLHFPTRQGLIKTLNGLNLNVPYKGRLGLVGESGVGKSVAAWATINLVKPPGIIVKGQVIYKQKNLLEMDEDQLQKIRGKEIALIVPRAHSQLNPLLPIGNQLMNTYLCHCGEKSKEAQEKAREKAIKNLNAVSIPDSEKRMKAYPSELSGGMAQRVVIAMALMNEPEVLIADDPTAGLDVTIQAQIMQLLNDLVTNLGTSMVIITHHLGLVAQHCDEVAIMYGGQIIETCKTDVFFEDARHPYSITLLSSVKGTKYFNKIEKLLRDGRFDPKNLPKGCLLYPRCKKAKAICESVEPPYVMVDEGHFVKCHNETAGGEVCECACK